MTNKVQTLDSLAKTIQKAKAEGKVSVHCHGVFDLLHVGHIKHFQEAKSFGDLLIVTVTPDEFVNKGPGRPAFDQTHRVEALAALESVDYVAINQWPTAVEAIKTLKPDIYCKGPDYRDSGKDITGKIDDERRAVESIGGEIRFTDDILFSSSHLLNRYWNFYSDSQKTYLAQLKKRYRIEKIHDHLDKLGSTRVLVVGETIIDEYIFCEALGKSGKEPVLAVQELSKERYLGGILAIANHLSNFSPNVRAVSFLGENLGESDFIRANLNNSVDCSFLEKSDSPTIIKKRFVDNINKTKLLGVYQINDDSLNESDEELFCDLLNDIIDQFDIVITSDYGHGIITDKAAEILTEKSRFLALNAQVNAANIGYHTISKYPRADCIVINETELRHEFRNRTGDLNELITRLSDRMESHFTIVTMGTSGAVLYENSDELIHCPAFASRVVDKIGAGDALLSLASLCLVNDTPADMALFIGSLAAAQSVETMGNSKPVSKTALIRAIDHMLR